MENQGTPNQDSLNQQFNQQFGQTFGQQQLPNSTGVLVFGIISIVGCFFCGIIGLILGIISLVLASKANALYQQNPGSYSKESVENLKAGKVCAIIGTWLSAIFLIVLIFFAILLKSFTFIAN
jgi:hypothetical protein